MLPGPLCLSFFFNLPTLRVYGFCRVWFLSVSVNTVYACVHAPLCLCVSAYVSLHVTLCDC